MYRVLQLYYAPRPFESFLYERLGVPFLGRYIPTGGSRFRVIPSFVTKGQPRIQVLKDFIKTTLIIETLHLLTAVFLIALLLPEIADDYQNGRYGEVGLYWAAIILPNAYPIMLQRYNRARALPILDRLMARHQVCTAA